MWVRSLGQEDPLEEGIATHSSILAWAISWTEEPGGLRFIGMQSQLFVTLWTTARQAPLPTGFSRQEYWSGLQCPPPGDLPQSSIKPTSLISPALAGGFFTTSTTWEALLAPNSKKHIQTPLHQLT